MHEYTSQAFHLQSNATGSQWLCVLTFFLLLLPNNCYLSSLICRMVQKELIIMRPCLFNTCVFAVVKKRSANTMKPLRGLFTYM